MFLDLLSYILTLKNELTKYEKQWNSEMENTSKICKEYDDIKCEREKSQKLIENEIKRCNELIAKENEFLRNAKEAGMGKEISCSLSCDGHS